MKDLVLTNIRKAYGDNLVLDGFSASFPAGRCTCIMGPSGCGKTTLLRILLGLEAPDAGTMTGRPSRCSAVFQENRLFESFSALSNLSAVRKGREKEELLQHLNELGLGESAYAPVSTLSGGMKRRVAIARAVLAPGDLLVLDEPFTGLDQETKAIVLSYVKHHTQGRTLVLVTHDPAERDALADQVIDMTPNANQAQNSGPQH